MGLINLLVVASMPVLKVLLLSGVGLFLAVDGVSILGEVGRSHLNNVVFYVFNPALVSSKLAQTVTFKSFLTLWLMPVNVVIAFVLGSALGWLLVKITKPPKHLNGLVIGSCSAGNLGNMMMIIIPAICKEEGSPFGDVDTCQTYGMGYASLSMALGAILLWSYVYNIVRVSCTNDDTQLYNGDTSTNNTQPLLSSSHLSSNLGIPVSHRIKQEVKAFAKSINVKKLLAPSTMGAIAGFVIGMVGPLRRLLIGSSAPLHVIQDSASLLGDAAIPTMTLILGANLVEGLKTTGIQLKIVMGIVVVRFIFLPIMGILIIRAAIHFGIMQFDPLFHFVLLLQYAVPPAMNIGTITQLFGAGQSECSVIMLWTYALASVSLTLWCTFFLWLVAS